MEKQKKIHPKVKTKLHPRSKHRERYVFEPLIETCPELANFVLINKYGDESINFFDPAAIKALNKALLMHYYKIERWDFPENYLCPPIPGRADYIHYIADLLAMSNDGEIPIGANIKCLDIGVGANCIYPIIGNAEYGWSFVGSEIDTFAIAAAKNNVSRNVNLQDKVEIRLQNDHKNIFKGIIKENEYFDIVICNPPFHASAKAALAASARKFKNLTGNKKGKPILNFGGTHNELWCEGGEPQFVSTMISESVLFKKSCGWFTTLISQKSHLNKIYKLLETAKASEVQLVEMGQGNKQSRIVAWRFV